MASQKAIDPDVEGLSNIIQSVITSPAVAETVKKIAFLREQIAQLQFDLQEALDSLPGHIQTAIMTPPSEG